jgi:seryl-tRNA synthetase
MIDLEVIRTDPAGVRCALADRLPALALLDRVLALDAERRRLVHTVNDLQARRNALTRAVRDAEDDATKQAHKAEIHDLDAELQPGREALANAQAELEALLLQVPNLPHPTVPQGSDAAANVEVRRWGDPRLPVPDPRPHWELGEALGGLEIARATGMAGSRFYALEGELAELELALIMFMAQHQVGRGYRLVIPPYLIGERAMVNCGQLPRFEDGLYHCERDDLYLVPTAESALASYHQGEILEAEGLPLWYAGFTPCFRREAGAGGRDTRGILRVHQFHKVELFKYTTPETSDEELERLVADAESVLQALELPYRVVLLAAGDMGFAASKTYDLEVWLPGQGAYREVSSCSTCGDFQARRANIRYRPAPGAKPRFVHMLNGSGLAVGRTLVAILENYQQTDGTVIIPKALRPYLGGKDRLVGTEQRQPALIAAR